MSFAATSLKMSTKLLKPFIKSHKLRELPDLCTAIESLDVVRVNLKSFFAIFQGFARPVQAQFREGEVQEQRKLSCLDALLLRVALTIPVSE